MSKELEKARELVAMLEERERKNKVRLDEIPVGGKFDTGIGRFIVLEQQLPQKDCIGKIFVLMMIVTNILRQSYLIFLKKKFFLNLKRNSVQIIYVADR